MSISIVACPKCSTLLLHDTVQCHRCRHVIRPDKVGELRDAALPSDDAVQKDLEKCKHCGETYRKGLVRCWSCGAFTRADIEAAYYRLLRGHARSLATAGQRTELQEITEEDARNNYGAEDELPTLSSERHINPDVSAVDHDFELSDNILLRDDGAIPPLFPVGLNPGDEDDLFGSALSDIPPIQSMASIPTISLTPPGEMPVFAPPLPGEAPPEQLDPIPLSIPGMPTSMADVTQFTEEIPEPPPMDEADSLLSIAKQEETEVVKSRRVKKQKQMTESGGFIVYCPMGCKIRVQERHRGKIGRCPKCETVFLVPMAKQTALSGSIPASASESATPAAGPPVVARPDMQWIPDVHLHRVLPEKLRIKADSLLNDFLEVDLGLSPERLLLVGLGGGGMFGGKNAKKKDAARAAIIEYLSSQPTLDKLPASFKQELPAESLSQLTMIQPPPEGAESLFGDVKLFGAGRIAVRLPKFDEKQTAFVSFSLSQFREFSRLLQTALGIERFGANCPFPYVDHYGFNACYLSNTPVNDLQQLEYYQKDPAFQLEVTGYRCKSCDIVICEATRQTQKLGGANGKAIAKAKCPKCKKPMGNQPVYQLAGGATPVEQVPPDATTPAGDLSAATTSV